MKLLTHNFGLLPALHTSLIAKKLLYGNEPDYMSLLSPVSTCLSSYELAQVTDDFQEVWNLYRIWGDLYRLSVEGSVPPWIQQYCEYGMTEEEIAAHRLVSSKQLEPKFGRIDYVSIGEQRHIAEVQWNSGGLGLFFGIADTYSSTFPFTSEKPVSDICHAFTRFIATATNSSQPVAVSAVRAPWMNGERYLSQRCADMGVTFIPIDREILPKVLQYSAIKYYLSTDEQFKNIHILFGQGFTKYLSPGSLYTLAQSSIDGSIWIENPLNYIYRQKWGLALPFMEPYCHLFPQALRDILIPSVLINGKSLDLLCVIPLIDHPHREQLISIKSLQDLLLLPESLRRCLVIKCGSGTGNYYSNGKGVFRLSGSKSSVCKLVDFIEQRVIHGEPWIIQPYIRKIFRLPVSCPQASADLQEISAHARIMMFGQKCTFNDEPTVIGGLANYGRHWKVTGSAPAIDTHGHMLGTAFTDIRIL
jgi:hypothetical protein